MKGAFCRRCAKAGVNHPSRPRAFNSVFFIRCVPGSLQMSIEPAPLFENHPSRPRAFQCVSFIRCVQSSFQMSVEPSHDPIQPVDQMLFFLQTMRLARIHYELAFNPIAFQRAIQHLALS